MNAVVFAFVFTTHRGIIVGLAQNQQLTIMLYQLVGIKRSGNYPSDSYKVMRITGWSKYKDGLDEGV